MKCALFFVLIPVIALYAIDLPEGKIDSTLDVKKITEVLQAVTAVIDVTKGFSSVLFEQSKLPLTFLDTIQQPIGKFLDLVQDLSVVTQDFLASHESGKKIVTIAQCSRMTDYQLHRQKIAENCSPVGCFDHPSCIKNGLESFILLLKPFIQDLFFGFSVYKKQRPGLLFSMLDLAKQDELKLSLKNAAEPLQEILSFLEDLNTQIEVLS